MRTRPAALELNPRIEHVVCDLIRAGLPVVTAARSVGVPERTVMRWMALGRRGEHRYRPFVDGVRAAQTERAYDVAELVAAARERLAP